MPDPFKVTDKLDPSLLQAMAARFEARGRHPRFAAMLSEYLEAMEIDNAATVLDMGCGSGVAARAVARRERFGGRVTGIDLSPYLVGVASRLAAEEGLAERVVFVAGDTRRVDAGGAAFDAVIAHTLVSHVDDPLEVLREAARLVKPGGVIGVFDGDYASLTFGDPRYDAKLIAATVTNPHVMRQMPSLLRAAGLELVRSFSYVLAEVGEADFWASAFDAYGRLLVQSGELADDEARAWVQGLRRASADGVFFGASNYYSYVARRS